MASSAEGSLMSIIFHRQNSGPLRLAYQSGRRDPQARNLLRIWSQIPQRDNPDVGVVWIVGENAERRRAQYEVSGFDDWHTNPSHGQHTRELTVREQRDVAGHC